MLGEQIGAFMIGLVDTWLAGYISKEATAAVGTAAYMAWFLTLAFSLVGVGASALVARSMGARDVETARRALNQMFAVSVVLGLVVSGIAFGLADAVSRALTRTEEAYGLCAMFLRIDALGYAFSCVNLFGAAVLRGAGDTRTPMTVTLLVNVVNALLSASLVFGWFTPVIGVKGIVIGTVVARLIGGMVMTAVLIVGVRGLRLRLSDMRPDPAMIWRMLRVGVPNLAESGAMMTAHFCFIWIISHSAEGQTATVNYAAHMVAMRAEAMSYLPAVAWMTAASTLVGQYLGAKRPDLAKRAGHASALQGVAITTLVGGVFFLFSRQIYQIFTLDSEVRAVGGDAFRYIGLVQPFLGAGIIYLGALRGAGDTRWPMVFTIIGAIGIRVSGAYVGAIVLEGGLIGAWCGMWGDNIVRSLLAFFRFQHGGWQRARI